MPTGTQLLAVTGLGATSGLLWLLAATGVPGIFLAYFCQLPLFLAGLSFGLGGALVAGAVATAISAVTAGLTGGVLFATLQLLVVLAVVNRALLNRQDEQGNVEWYPPGLLLCWITGIGAALLIGGLLVLSMQPDGAVASLQEMVRTTLGPVLEQQAGDQSEQLIATISYLLPGISAASWLVMVVVNGTLAQWVAVRLERNLRPTPAFSQVELPPTFPPLLIAAALIGWLVGGMPGLVGQSLTLLLIGMYFLIGLAVMHVICRRSDYGQILLIVFYVLLVLLYFVPLFVAFLGLMEQWAHFRRPRSLPPGPPSSGPNA